MSNEAISLKSCTRNPADKAVTPVAFDVQPKPPSVALISVGNWYQKYG